jgi:hypothetical protein
MTKRIVLELDAGVEETLRAMALAKGHVCVRGPRGARKEGSITAWLTAVAKTWVESAGPLVDTAVLTK